MSEHTSTIHFESLTAIQKLVEAGKQVKITDGKNTYTVIDEELDAAEDELMRILAVGANSKAGFTMKQVDEKIAEQRRNRSNA
jgi:hypothetical protein